MDLNASSRVFQGQIGTGDAQVYGSPGDPLGAYRRNKKEEEAHKLYQEKQQAAAKQKRDQEMKEVLSEEPEKTFFPFEEVVRNEWDKKVRSPSLDYMNRGGALDQNFRAWRDKKADEVNAIARKGNYAKDVITATRDEVSKNKYLDFDFYNTAINDTYLTPEGKLKDDFDPNQIQDVVRNNPQGFLSGEYSKDFVKDIRENVIKYKEEQYKRLGVDPNVLETNIREMKSKLYKIVDGRIVMKNGVPEINMTEDVIDGYMSDPYAERYIKDKAEKEGISVSEAIEGEIRRHAYGQDNIVSTKITKPSSSSGLSGYGDIPKPILNRRLESINAIQNAFFDDSGNKGREVNEAAQENLGKLVNGKHQGKVVMDAQFVSSGTDSIEDSDVYDGEVPEKLRGKDLIALKMKDSATRAPHFTFLDLSDPGTAKILNSIMGTASGEGPEKLRNFSWENQLSPYNEKTQLYKSQYGEKTRDYDWKTRDADINDRWKKGTDLEGMKGAVDPQNGKEIKNVTASKSWGSVSGFKVQYKDGTLDEIDAGDKERLISIWESNNIYSTGAKFDEDEFLNVLNEK